MHGKKTMATVLAALLAGLSPFATLAQGNIAACREIDDSLERLTCYDEIPLVAAEVPETEEAFETFAELIAFFSTGPRYGDEVESWRPSQSQARWLAEVTGINISGHTLHLAYEGAILQGCRLLTGRVWRARLQSYDPQSGAFLPDSLPLDRQPYMAYYHSIDLDQLAPDLTRDSPGEVIMERNGQINYIVFGGIGLEDFDRIDAKVSAGLDSLATRSVQAPDMGLFDLENHRSMSIRFGRAHPEDAAAIRAAFLDLAESCQE